MGGTPGDVVRREVDGRVGRIVLARPDKLNALSRSVLEGLVDAARWFDEQPDVHVVVVAGEGRAFSAGFDLADRTWGELGPTGSAELGRAMADAVAGMRALTIAAIQGHCIGGGVVLAAACDLRLAADGARFRIPEVDLGIPLFWSGVPRLARELGPALTKELVLTGRVFEADEARTIRFVNRVVPTGALAAAAAGLAGELAAKPALVLRTTKAQVDDAVPLAPPGVGDLASEIAGYAASLADPECREIAASYVRAREA